MAVLYRQSSNENQNSSDIPFIEIIEQPDSVRYRYECEGRTAGSILGVNSSNDYKTYPTIKINGYKGKVVIIVSCVTKDKPYRPHPCRLVGGEFCKDGIFKTEINNESMTLSLQHVGIQCVKRSNVDQALQEREKRRVDPFITGYSHRDFDYNTVKLCFQAIIKGSQGGQAYQLEPVVSDNIPDKKMMTSLMIFELSHASASISGNTKVILLCDKVMKDDIEIVFFEMMNGKRIWECLADFNPSNVHKQAAISFKTPTYYKPNIEYPVCVNIQLRRPSDGKCGKCYPFILTPGNSGEIDFTRRKRNRTSSDNTLEHFPSNPNQQPNIPETSQTQLNTIASGNIFDSSSNEFIQRSSNNSIYNQLSPTYSCINLQTQNQSLNKNHNMYGQEVINFQQMIDGPSTSASMVCQMLPSPGISSEIPELLATYSTENNQSTNNMDISSLSNLENDLYVIENLSSELSTSLSISNI